MSRERRSAFRGTTEHDGTDTTPEKKIIRPYGDTTGDGMVQMSFTLPVPLDKRS